MRIKHSDEFVTGVSDYLFLPKGKKDIRTQPPQWMKFKLHILEWQRGFDHAKSLDISR